MGFFFGHTFDLEILIFLYVFSVSIFFCGSSLFFWRVGVDFVKK